MYDYNCVKCGGLVPEPYKVYGYSGRFCQCEKPEAPQTRPTALKTEGTCTCNSCPIHLTTFIK